MFSKKKPGKTEKTIITPLVVEEMNFNHLSNMLDFYFLDDDLFINKGFCKKISILNIKGSLFFSFITSTYNNSVSEYEGFFIKTDNDKYELNKFYKIKISLKIELLNITNNNIKYLNLKEKYLLINRISELFKNDSLKENYLTKMINDIYDIEYTLIGTKIIIQNKIAFDIKDIKNFIIINNYQLKIFINNELFPLNINHELQKLILNLYMGNKDKEIEKII